MTLINKHPAANSSCTVQANTEELDTVQLDTVELETAPNHPAQYIISTNVAWEWRDGNIVVWHVRNRQGYRLHGSALIIWPMLSEPRSLSELIQELLKFYDGSPGQVSSDTEEFLSQLEVNALISEHKELSAFIP